MPLNRNKSYGEVNGGNMPWKYEQGGRYYNHQGLEVDPETGEALENPDVLDPAKTATHGVPAGHAAAQSAQIAQHHTQAPAENETPVPEIGEGMEQINDVDLSQFPDDDGLDELKTPEIRDALDRLGVEYKARDSKPDLLTMLREELTGRRQEHEDEQENEQESEEGVE